MGTGNLNYRQDVWGGGPPVYLARASALRLLSHPLITGSDRGRWDKAGASFDSLMFSTSGVDLRIEGTVTGSVPTYAVVAYVWPIDHKTDHAARTYPALAKGGGFMLDLDGLRPATYHLKLVGLQANGATTTHEFRLGFDARGMPATAPLNDGWVVDRAERAVMTRRPEARRLLSDQAIAAATSPESASKLRVLRDALAPPTPIDLARARGDRVFLSDAAWTSARVGWGQVARNHFWFDDRIQDGVFLTLGGRFYEKGLYAHSPSRYTFAVNRKWKTFRSTIGLRDGATAQGSAIFTVRGDGRELYRSRALRAGSQEDLNVDISRVKELELRAEGAEGHNHNSWAIWADPIVSR
jgi:NPCBM/NEW2 domain